MNTREFSELVQLVEKGGTTQFIKFTSGARVGSIGRILGLDRQYWQPRFVVGWDDRDNSVVVPRNATGVIWHKGFNGPTIWNFGKAANGSIKGPVDGLGQTFLLDDFVLYQVKKNNFFGVVTEIKPTGAVYVRRTGILNPTANSGTLERIQSKINAVIIRDNLKTVLLKKKLSQ